jgi:hypothetical protein
VGCAIGLDVGLRRRAAGASGDEQRHRRETYPHPVLSLHQSSLGAMPIDLVVPSLRELDLLAGELDVILLSPGQLRYPRGQLGEAACQLDARLALLARELGDLLAHLLGVLTVLSRDRNLLVELLEDLAHQPEDHDRNEPHGAEALNQPDPSARSRHVSEHPRHRSGGHSGCSRRCVQHPSSLPAGSRLPAKRAKPLRHLADPALEVPAPLSQHFELPTAGTSHVDLRRRERAPVRLQPS